LMKWFEGNLAKPLKHKEQLSKSTIMISKKDKFTRRKTKVKAKVGGTKKRPRLSVYRSNRSMYAQIVDDEKGNTILGLSSNQLPETKTKGKSKIEVAGVLGEEVAKLAKKKKVSKVVFDKSGYKYHGRVKELAEGARKGGLKF
jgi:large subunit ribosomal protein L18